MAAIDILCKIDATSNSVDTLYKEVSYIPMFGTNEQVLGQASFQYGISNNPLTSPPTYIDDETAAAALWPGYTETSVIDYANSQAQYTAYDSANLIFMREGERRQVSRDITTALSALTLDAITVGSTNKAFTSTEKTKLSGITTGATANDTDANLKNRANHTGTQAASTITGLATVATSGSYSDLTGKPSVPVMQAYEGVTQHLGAFPVFKSATVSSGTAVMYLTADGTSGGAALFPNGIIQDSVNVIVSDATASYQMSWAFTNSNKTLTVTANKLTTSNILTGVLGQAQANSATIRLTVWGY